jgi:Glycosyl transferase family 11
MPEFVGVHVRRTDYMRHMSIIHQGSTAAGPEFFRKAMEWLYSTVRKPLIFIIVSDDADWAKENIVSLREDAYLGGALVKFIYFVWEFIGLV